MKLVCPECKADVSPDDVDLRDETALCTRCQNFFECKEWIEAVLITPESLQHPPKGVSYETTITGFKVAVSTRSYWWMFWGPNACLWSGLLLFFSYACSHAQPADRKELFLFLVPFYLLGVAFWGATLMAIFGRVSIEVDGDSACLFKGIGLIGRKRYFDWSGVEKIRFSVWGSPSRNPELIYIEGDEVIKVAMGVKHERLRYMLIALRHHRLRKKHS